MRAESAGDDGRQGPTTRPTNATAGPTGRSRVLASVGNALFAEEELVVDELVDEVYARRILLRQR